MLLFFRILSSVLIICSALNPTITLACSVSRDYVRPSNFELAQLSQLIAVVTPIRQKRVEDDRLETTYQVDRVYKGNVSGTLKLTGWSRLGKTEKSDPDDIVSAHPEAYAGPCNRTTFSKRNQYLFFLSKDNEGNVRLAGPAFSRESEDYYGEESLWAKTVRYYLEVQKKYEPMQQLMVLSEKYNSLISKDMSSHERALALDIADHLRSRSPYKPTQYLLDSYYALENGDELPFAVRSPEADKEGSQADLLTALVSGPQQDKRFDIGQQKAFILWSLVNGDHPTAMPLFFNLANQQNQRGNILGAVLSFYSKHDNYRAAVGIANRNAFRVLNTSPKREVDEFLRGVYGMNRVYTDYKKKKWQGDEYAKKWWPEFALAIDANRRFRFGQEGYGAEDEAALIEIQNYRERPEVTLNLANGYENEEVIEWAKSEISSFITANDEDIDDDILDLPVQVLLLNYRSYESDSQKLIDSFFCENEGVRYKIISQLGLVQNYSSEDLLFRIARHDGLSGHEPSYVIQTMAMFVAESRKEFLRNLGWGFSDVDELMVAFIKGEEIKEDDKDRQPLVCN